MRTSIVKSVALKLMMVGFISTASTASAAAEATTSGCTVAGPENAPVVVEEFVDFNCVYCAKGAAALNGAIKDFPGQVKVVLRNMPLPFHKSALTAAKAFTAICLQYPSLAATFQNKLFENQDRLNKDGDDYVFQLASELGVNVTRLKTDMTSKEVEQSLAADKKRFEESGFKGTPSFIIGDEKIQGARDEGEFKRAIQRQLLGRK